MSRIVIASDDSTIASQVGVGLMTGYFAAHARKQKRSRLTGTLILAGTGCAAIVGCLGGYIYLSYLPYEEEIRASMAVPQPSSAEATRVLLARASIEVGTRLTPELFVSEERPSLSLPAKVVRTFSEIEGHYAYSRISPGQLVLLPQVTPVRPINSVTASIPPGYRAVSITVDEKSGVEGWARPGAMVDVVWTSQIRNLPGATVIVQNAKVLSAERITDSRDMAEGGPAPSTVTLLVPSPDANKIQLGSTTGLLSLALRGDGDASANPVTSMTTNDLLNRSDEPLERVSYGTVSLRENNGEKKEFDVSRKGELVPR